MDVQNNMFIYYDCLVSNYNSTSAVPLKYYNDTRLSPLIKGTK